MPRCKIGAALHPFGGYTAEKQRAYLAAWDKTDEGPASAQGWRYQLPTGEIVMQTPYAGRRTGCALCPRLACYTLTLAGHNPARNCESCAQSYLHRLRAAFLDSTIPGDTPDDCPDHGPHCEEYCPGCRREKHRADCRAAGVTPGY